MAKVVQVFQYKLALFAEDRKRNIYAHRNRINRLFDFLKKEIGQKPVIWKYYCEFLELELEYLQEMSNHYTNLYQLGKVDEHDMVPEYASPSDISAYTASETQRIREAMLQSKQKECNMLMVVGW